MRAGDRTAKPKPVREHGANEDEAIAVVLHDAVEDQGGKRTRERIRKRFGEKVAGSSTSVRTPTWS